MWLSIVSFADQLFKVPYHLTHDVLFRELGRKIQTAQRKALLLLSCRSPENWWPTCQASSLVAHAIAKVGI
jgi:hypothetical protein